MAAHARDVNIFIWTARKSVDHGTNDRGKVHGDGTRADGRRLRYWVRESKIWARELDKARVVNGTGNPM